MLMASTEKLARTEALVLAVTRQQATSMGLCGLAPPLDKAGRESTVLAAVAEALVAALKYGIAVPRQPAFTILVRAEAGEAPVDVVEAAEHPVAAVEAPLRSLSLAVT